MPPPSENLVDIENRLHRRLLDFDRLDDEWPKGATALVRAKIGRQHSDALSDIADLEKRIFEARAETLDDAAVQLRRLVAVMDEIDTRRLYCHRQACTGWSRRPWVRSSGRQKVRWKLWREDNRRLPNGELFELVVNAALAHSVSRQWKGYWQRKR